MRSRATIKVIKGHICHITSNLQAPTSDYFKATCTQERRTNDVPPRSDTLCDPTTDGDAMQKRMHTAFLIITCFPVFFVELAARRAALRGQRVRVVGRGGEYGSGERAWRVGAGRLVGGLGRGGACRAGARHAAPADPAWPPECACSVSGYTYGRVCPR